MIIVVLSSLSYSLYIKPSLCPIFLFSERWHCYIYVYVCVYIYIYMFFQIIVQDLN